MIFLSNITLTNHPPNSVRRSNLRFFFPAQKEKNQTPRNIYIFKTVFISFYYCWRTSNVFIEIQRKTNKIFVVFHATFHCNSVTYVVRRRSSSWKGRNTFISPRYIKSGLKHMPTSSFLFHKVGNIPGN